MAKHDVHRCKVCGRNEYEARMIEHNDQWVCGITCHIKLKEKEDAALNRIDCASDVIPLRPGSRR